MLNINKQDLDLLENNICQQANYFLLESNEFYPFGIVLDKNHNLKPVGAYLGNEFPQPKELFDFLIKSIEKGVYNKEYKAGAIAIDVIIKNSNESKSAVEITIINKSEKFKSYFIYKKEGNNYSFSKTVV